MPSSGEKIGQLIEERKRDALRTLKLLSSILGMEDRTTELAVRTIEAETSKAKMLLKEHEAKIFERNARLQLLAKSKLPAATFLKQLDEITQSTLTEKKDDNAEEVLSSASHICEVPE